MNIPRIVNAIGYIDDDLITAALEDPPRKRHNLMIKWIPVAACLALVMIAGILVPHFLRTAAIAESKYKYHVSEKERSIEWPWKYKTLVEKYPVVKFNGKQFTAKSQNSIHTDVMGEVIGSCVAEGVDSDTGKTYTETYEVRKIKGISEELMIAVGNENGFYVYATEEEAPDTLGKLLELYELSQNIELNYVTKCEDYEEKEELLLDKGKKIWQILSGCGDAKLDDTSDFFERENRRYLAFTATSEALGVYNRVIYIFEDGYFATNIFDYEYSYFIGKEVAGQIIGYVQKHSTETKSSTSRPTISGTVIEIGNGYIMVDDTILCRKTKAGKKYKVYTDNIKVGRWIESGEIKAGDLVVVEYEGEISSNCEVKGAYSIFTGVLEENGILNQE
ncbi:hypothetical protein [Blautia sp. MSJ-19]|uniref:hypothetical protein n=1 Tax=Blautia sp. MSJ-19 TaxID=2841517 RepID=UPI001C0F296C|nr:hypothetical protein [Blautia sp. MSJ-19]MBU5479876.1 hypothetical protein [Blautia sp. MSJ-19]